MEKHMLWMISVIMVFLWLLGFMGRQSLGGFIHILPVVAVMGVLLSIFQRWRIRRSEGIVQRAVRDGEGWGKRKQ
jgi:hypothetical protein